MDKFAQLLEQLARLVGIQVERLWPRVVRVYWIKALGELLIGPIIAVITMLPGWSLLGWAWALPARSYYDGNPLPFLPGIILMTVGALTLLVWLLSIPGNVAALIDPEAAFVENTLAATAGK